MGIKAKKLAVFQADFFALANPNITKEVSIRPAFWVQTIVSLHRPSLPSRFLCWGIPALVLACLS